MRNIIITLIAVITFTSCDKDDYTSAPQIKFKNFQPDQGTNRMLKQNQPFVIFELTDKEGDFDTDTAFIYIRNTLTNKIDSGYRFPELGSAAKKNFKADIQIGLFDVMGGRNITPGNQPPFVDTIGFEIWVKDKAKHQSNVIIAPSFYYFTLP